MSKTSRPLSEGRTAILYHHNSRFKGDHEQENAFWREQLGPGTLSLRFRAGSSRTFFITNPTPTIEERTHAFLLVKEREEI